MNNAGEDMLLEWEALSFSSMPSYDVERVMTAPEPRLQDSWVIWPNTQFFCVNVAGGHQDIFEMLLERSMREWGSDYSPASWRPAGNDETFALIATHHALLRHLVGMPSAAAHPMIDMSELKGRDLTISQVLVQVDPWVPRIGRFSIEVLGSNEEVHWFNQWVHDAYCEIYELFTGERYRDLVIRSTDPARSQLIVEKCWSSISGDRRNVITLDWVGV